MKMQGARKQLQSLEFKPEHPQILCRLVIHFSWHLPAYVDSGVLFLELEPLRKQSESRFS